MPLTKKRIKVLVESYIKENPLDWDTFKEGVKMTRKFTKDDFATLYGSNDSRALYEMPEKLYEEMIISLDEDEMVWFKSKIGSLWFARTFKDFALANKI